MTRYYLHEKISLILSILILNNYFLLSLNFPIILIKINLFLFLLTIGIFFLKNISENYYLKIFFLFIIFIALGTPTFEWDPRSIWIFHAKRIFYDGSIFSVADNYASFSNNEFPSLAPAFASSLALFVGYWNEVFPKISFTLMFLPPLILTYTFLKNTQYLIFLSIVLFTIGKFILNGWADGLVAIYFGLSSLLMYLLIIKRDKFIKNKLIFYYTLFCFLATLTLLKDEGAALLLILFVTTFLLKIFKSELKNDIIKLIFLSLSFIPIILWKIFCYKNGLDNHHINLNLDILPRFYDLDNYKLIVYFMFLNEKFIICLSFFLLSFWINWDKELFSFVSVALMMYIVILFVVFLSSPFDFYMQLDSTATRVIKTLNFSLALFGLYNLKEKIKNF